MKKILINISLLLILFIGNIIIENNKFYFLLIYISIAIYHIYIFFLIKKNHDCKISESKNFIIISILLFIITYFIIYDSNPFICIITFYTFYPYYIKAILVIFIHTYILSKYLNYINRAGINSDLIAESSFKFKKQENMIYTSYFLFDIFNHFKKNKYCKFYLLLLIIFLIIDVILFLNRIDLWIYFNKVDKTLPFFTSRNTTFYIASNIFNIENIIVDYLNQMKKLINYLGEKNVIISFVENGDSKDNTRIYLKEFQHYLNEKLIINKFVLNHEIDDPRKNYFSTLKYTRFRIEYYSKLRNKCLELLYELPNIDYNNTIVLFFNDILFKYQDIINLLSTNKGNYDAVCGLDMSFLFYDRWVSIDLEGEGMTKYFPFFINKEGQDLVIDHKPIRVFSCWNGVIGFKASPLKDKKIQFRYKNNPVLPKYILDNPSKIYYESECTYFNIDLFSLGYTKKFINPDVRVSYEYKYLRKSRYYTPTFKHFLNYFWIYFVSLFKKRNKYMSNYEDKKIKLNTKLENWYIF